VIDCEKMILMSRAVAISFLEVSQIRETEAKNLKLEIKYSNLCKQIIEK